MGTLTPQLQQLPRYIGLLLCALITITATRVRAQHEPIYFVLDYAMTQLNQLEIPSGEFENRDPGFGMAVGYTLHPYMGIELSWQEPNRFDFQTTTGRGNLSTELLDLSSRFTWPITRRYELFARLGATHWQFGINGANIVVREESGYSLNYGMGLAYTINPSATQNHVQASSAWGRSNKLIQYQLVGGWSRLQAIGEVDSTGETAVDRIGVGLVMRY